MVDATSQFIESLRDFLRKESPPSAVHAADEAREPPLDLLRQLGSLGYLTIGLPAEWGGESESENDTFALVRMMEEIGYHNLALGHLAGLYDLRRAATPPLRHRRAAGGLDSRSA